MRCARSIPPGFTLIELLVVVVIIGIIVAIALPNYIKIKDKAKETEVKAGLHNIQTVLEQFGVDNSGSFPRYLIGGEPKALVYEIGPNGEIYPEVIEAIDGMTSDPLIREGYLDSYPANPFVRNASSVHQMQRYIGDPLRNSFRDGQQMGTRFGSNCDSMGQVLCDSRYMKRLYYDRDAGEQYEINTWSNIQYDFYDVWLGHLKRPFLSGAFLYKSMGEVMPTKGRHGKNEYVEMGDGVTAAVPVSNRENATFPIDTTDYILSAWGGPRHKGLDILGEEPLVIFTLRGTISRSKAIGDFVFDPDRGIYDTPGVGQPAETFELLGIPSWTRGVSRTHIGPLWGSPYGPSYRDQQQLARENPNGIKDGLLMVLTSGD